MYSIATGRIVVNICMAKFDTAKCRVTRILKKYELIEIAGGKCSKCGYARNISALVFHHVEEKNIALNGPNLRVADDKLKKELDNCSLLCQNCHSELHNPLLSTQHVKKAFEAFKSSGVIKREIYAKYFDDRPHT